MWPNTKYEGGQVGEKKLKPNDSIHWRVPTIMLASLVGGIAMAIGHHAFYQSLHGTVVSGKDQQTWNIRIGTGFAFVIKLWLATAVSIACVQNLWLLLYRKPVTVSSIDSLFGVLNNAWSFFSLHSWLQGPVVILLAAISWCIPFSAVVTPSTLTVELSHDLAARTAFMPMANLKWTNLTMAETGGVGYYTNPTADIRRITMSVGTTGSILGISPPAPNSSYSMSFFAPALKCETANATVISTVKSEWRSGMSIFTGFVPNYGKNLSQTYRDSTNLKSDKYSTSPVSLDTVSEDYAKIFLAAGEPPTVVECGFFNASYEVDFKFENGVQTLDVQKMSYLNGVVRVPSTGNDYSNLDKLWTQYNYQALMDSFGMIYTGSVWQAASGGTYQYATSMLWTPLTLAEEVKTGMVTIADGIKNLANGMNFTLAQGAEEIFKNMTLSVFSSPYYLQPQNETSEVKVTIHEPQNKYVYAPKYLWVSYGLAILFAIIGTLLGVLALIKNGASFSNNFSTVLRVTRNPEIMTLVTPDSTNGAEPKHHRLADVKMSMAEISDENGDKYWSMAISRSSSAGPEFRYVEDGSGVISTETINKNPAVQSRSLNP